MTYADLSDEERAVLQAFMQAYRPIMGETARLFAKLARLGDAYAGGISTIVAKLDDGEPINDSTSLAGAGTLLKENVAGTMGDFAYALGAFNSDANRQRYIQAAGLANVI